MKTKIIIITAVFAAATAQANDLCPRGTEYLQRLQQAGVKAEHIGRHMPMAVQICARPEPMPVPKTPEEYKAAQARKNEERMREMQALPEKQPVRLWD